MQRASFYMNLGSLAIASSKSREKKARTCAKEANSCARRRVLKDLK